MPIDVYTYKANCVLGLITRQRDLYDNSNPLQMSEYNNVEVNKPVLTSRPLTPCMRPLLTIPFLSYTYSPACLHDCINMYIKIVN